MTGEKMVFVVVVKTRHVYADLFQWFRNALGMNLVAYECMISAAIQEAYDKLRLDNPDVYDVRIGTAQVVRGAAEIIVYGKVWVP